jgi:hypothetical protein
VLSVEYRIIVPFEYENIRSQGQAQVIQKASTGKAFNMAIVYVKSLFSQVTSNAKKFDMYE